MDFLPDWNRIWAWGGGEEGGQAHTTTRLEYLPNIILLTCHGNTFLKYSFPFYQRASPTATSLRATANLQHPKFAALQPALPSVVGCNFPGGTGGLSQPGNPFAGLRIVHRSFRKPLVVCRNSFQKSEVKAILKPTEACRVCHQARRSLQRLQSVTGLLEWLLLEPNPDHDPLCLDSRPTIGLQPTL